MEAAATERVRSFNRTVTQRIGVLQDGYLSRGRPLGASRVLWRSATTAPTSGPCAPGSTWTPAI